MYLHTYNEKKSLTSLARLISPSFFLLKSTILYKYVLTNKDIVSREVRRTRANVLINSEKEDEP